MSEYRQQLTTAKRWVVKLGSALMTSNGSGLDLQAIQSWADQVMQLQQQGIDVVVVSSGAVAAGMTTLGWQERPTALIEQQVAAAVGQKGLVQVWDQCFQRHDAHTAQVLLTHEDIVDRRRYLNARATLKRLIKLGIVPIINENDTVSNEEIRFGDNDSLAGLVANLIEADLVVLLTDQEGLYDADPREHEQAKLVKEARAGDPALIPYAGKGGALGRGGMLTKLRAAEIAARSGASTVIANGRLQDCLLHIQQGQEVGTLLHSDQPPLAARKQWLAGQSNIHGFLELDEGAVRVLRDQGKSLLAVGVKGIRGEFSRGEVVGCLDPSGVEVARGLVNYDAHAVSQIMGQASQDIQGILGYSNEPELIHRDNLILV